MREDEIVFCDGIDGVSMTAGMVRMDLYALSPVNKDKQGRPLRMSAGQVVMSPDAFLQAFATMQNLINQLIEKGVLKRAPGDPANVEVPPTP